MRGRGSERVKAGGLEENAKGSVGSRPLGGGATHSKGAAAPGSTAGRHSLHCMWQRRAAAGPPAAEAPAVPCLASEHTAHPDDECMFFGPALCRVLRDHEVHVLCLSNGART